MTRREGVRRDENKVGETLLRLLLSARAAHLRRAPDEAIGVINIDVAYVAQRRPRILSSLH